MRPIIVAVSLGLLAACHDRFRQGAVYSPAANSSIGVAFDSSGSAFKIRPIGTFDDAAASIRIASVNDGTILLVVSGPRASWARIPARRLKSWFAGAETWVKSPGRPELGTGARQIIALMPDRSAEADADFYELELSRSIPPGGPPNYQVHITVRDVSAWMRRARRSEIARFVTALGEASDSSLAMSRRP